MNGTIYFADGHTEDFSNACMINGELFFNSESGEYLYYQGFYERTNGPGIVEWQRTSKIDHIAITQIYR